MATLAKQTANLDITWGLWAMAAIVPGVLSIFIIPYFIYSIYKPEITKTREAQILARKELDIMGPMTNAEKIITGVFLGALLLWSTSQYTHVNATIAALLGVTIMIIFNVLEWNDVISEKGAWDSMMWMGGIIGLAQALNKAGFIQWFAQNIAGIVQGVSWPITLGILFIVYLYSHYAFASLSAHATAMYAVFLAVAVAAGAPPYYAAIGLAVLSNLMAGLTHYATGAAPIYFGSGYINQKDWWRIGFACSLVNFIIWIGIGSLWWKIIGLW